MSELNSLIEIVAFFSTALGSGIAASWLFDRLRDAFPCPQLAPANPVVSVWYRALWAPRYARITSIALAVLVAAVAGASVALLAGQEFNAVAAAFLSPVVSQLQHGIKHLSAE